MNSPKTFDNNEPNQVLNECNVIKESILNKLPVGIIIVHYPEYIIEFANQRMLTIFKISSMNDLINHQVKDFYPDDEISLQVDMFTQKVLHDGYGILHDIPYHILNGQIIYTDISGQRFECLEDGSSRIIWTYMDVSERHTLNENLERQVFIDNLTDLPNRRALEKEIERAMARAIRHNRILGIVMIDLDGFKPINDNYGHEAGDIVLQTLAKRMQESIRRTDFISRLGGDEFIILIEDCTSMENINIVLERIGQVVHTPVKLKNNTTITVNLSAGLCLYPMGEDTINNPKVLIRYADQALYDSKEHKSDRLRFWTLYGKPASIRINHIQTLLQEKGVQIFYQPIMDNQLGRVVGVEALARIQENDGHILSPAQFLPYLHLYNIFDLSKQVISQSTKDILQIETLGFNLWVSINIDSASFSIRRMKYLKEAIAKSPINPSRIVLEIFGSQNFIEQKELLNYLLDLKSLGILLALDDIERTNSSLLDLKNLPISQIKLDQNFVRTLDKNPSGIVFTRTILDISETLGAIMVAKGIENDDILDAMIVLGVPLLQGYAIAKPMPFDKLLSFLKETEIFKKNQIHPNSLLGLYAKHLDYDKSLRKNIRINPQIISNMELDNVKNCPSYEDLNRLVIAKKDSIHRLHNEYHEVLHRMKNNLTGKQIKNDDWDNLEKIHRIFLEAILNKYNRKEKNDKSSIKRTKT